MKKRLVVDGSVILKLFLKKNETGLEEVERLYGLVLEGEMEVFCPFLLILELVNVLSRAKGVSEKILLAAGQRIVKMGIIFEEIGMDEWADLVVLMRKYGLTAYDASYLWLAKEKGCKLVTADRQLLKIKKYCVPIEGLDC